MSISGWVPTTQGILQKDIPIARATPHGDERSTISDHLGEIATTAIAGIMTTPPGARRRIVESWTSTEQRLGSSNHLEIRRFQAIPENDRARAWEARRRHTPSDKEIPLSLGLDALHWRMPEEESYGHRLARLAPLPVRSGIRPERPAISLDLVCFRWPLIPFIWPYLPPPIESTYRNFPPKGDLADPVGGEIALDSAWRLREGSVRAGTGDPGRLAKEVLKEARDFSRSQRNDTRGYQQFIPFHMVEYYDQGVAARADWYPARPNWWASVWVSQRMFVPLPPVLTYKSGAFLTLRSTEAERLFFDAVLETEWTVMVFSRWCTDIPQRGLLWHLPARVRDNIRNLGIQPLLEGSSYRVVDVERWLWDHDQYRWAERSQRYHWSFGNATQPAKYVDSMSFVRTYPNAVMPGVGEADEVVAVGAFDVPVPRLRSRPSSSIDTATPLPAPFPYGSNITSLPAYTSDDPYAPRPIMATPHDAANDDPYAIRPASGIPRVADTSPPVTVTLLQDMQIYQLDASVRRHRAQILGVDSGSSEMIREADLVRYAVNLRRAVRDLEEQLQKAEEDRDRSSVRAMAMEDAYIALSRGVKRPRIE
jgi:hypothetical protein